MIFAGTKGYVDDVPVSDVQRYESELLAFMHTRHEGLMEEIRSTGAMNDDAVKTAVEAFGAEFQATSDAADEAES